MVIGRGGSKIREIQDSFNVHVKIGKRNTKYVDFIARKAKQKKNIFFSFFRKQTCAFRMSMTRNKHIFSNFGIFLSVFVYSR